MIGYIYFRKGLSLFSFPFLLVFLPTYLLSRPNANAVSVLESLQSSGPCSDTWAHDQDINVIRDGPFLS